MRHKQRLEFQCCDVLECPAYLVSYTRIILTRNIQPIRLGTFEKYINIMQRAIIRHDFSRIICLWSPSIHWRLLSFQLGLRMVVDARSSRSRL